MPEIPASNEPIPASIPAIPAFSDGMPEMPEIPVFRHAFLGVGATLQI